MNESRIIELVDRVIESGRPVEDVCASSPELVPEVRKRLNEYLRLEGAICEFFPPRETTVPEAERGGLPRIAGYEVRSLLGSGGMGEVYLAQHLSLGREVAMKMLSAGRDGSGVDRARFLREAKSLAALRHPNIVSVFDVGETDRRPYFTMEHMAGGTLAAKLGGTPQPELDAARSALVLAHAVSHAHAAGIVHRDLKPANILLDTDGTLKVSDFGIARSQNGDPTLTLDHVRMGTPSYMSPEQMIGDARRVGPATDVYSLGAVLYELLTGRPPFRGATAAETERQVLQEDPVRPRALNPAVSRDIETICLHCLQKSEGRRYASVAELAADLDSFLHGRPIRARPVGVFEQGLKWVRRHPSVTVAVLAAAIAAAVVLGAMLWTVSQRAAIVQSVSEDLAETAKRERAGDWRGARNILERAKTRVAGGMGHDALRVEVQAVERELALVDTLAKMRLDRAASHRIEFDRAQWWAAYRDVFAGAGLLNGADTAETFAARIAASPASRAFIEALDDWSICSTTIPDLEFSLATARAADRDPVWRDRARSVAVWKSDEAVAELAREVDVERQPVGLLLTIAGLHSERHAEAGILLLRKIQAAYPSDFWANFALGEALSSREDLEAIAFFRAAIAVRPEAAAAHAGLANSLGFQRRLPEAIVAMKTALALDSESGVPQYNLAIWLFQQQRYREAAKHSAIAARLRPGEPMVHGIRGSILLRLGKYSEAIQSFERAIELLPPGHEKRASFGRAILKCEEGLICSPTSSYSPPS